MVTDDAAEALYPGVHYTTAFLTPVFLASKVPAFDFCNIGNIGLVDVEDEQTLSSRMRTSDVAKVGGVTFAERHWKKKGQKSGPTKNMITPDGRYEMEGTVLIKRKGDRRTLCWWK